LLLEGLFPTLHAIHVVPPAKNLPRIDIKAPLKKTLDEFHKRIKQLTAIYPEKKVLKVITSVLKSDVCSD